MTAPLIYGLLLKQCSLSPTHYEFTFTYITACILHTNFLKKRRKQLGFVGAQKQRRFVKKRATHLENYQGLFLPFSGRAQMSTAQKKGGTNLNVKVSVINHPGGKGGTVPVQAVHGCVGSKESAPHIGGRVRCGRHLAK